MITLIFPQMVTYCNADNKKLVTRLYLKPKYSMPNGLFGIAQQSRVEINFSLAPLTRCGSLACMSLY